MKNKLLLSSVATCVLISSGLNAQVTSPTNFATPPPQYVGWSGAVLSTSKPLDLKNGFNNQPINFFTNNSGTNGVANAIQRMTILGTTGFVGIGTNFITPLNLVDVRNGNINVGQGTGANVAASPQAYMIGGNNILWHKGEIRNLFVGVNAGANTTGATAFQNTFIGSSAGLGNINGQRNTFIGANAGESITAGNFNTFVGTEAGKLLQTGDHNTFVGEQCADKQINGSNNSYFGAHTAQGPNPNAGTGIGNDNTFLGAFSGSDITNGDGNTFSGLNSGRNCDNGNFNTFSGINSGNQCTTGSFNTMTGRQSGFFTTTGNDNVFMGNRAGFFNTSGSSNTYIGTNTGFPSAGVNTPGNTATNSTALGNGAQIRRSDVMILGNNSVNVGIGLSNDITTAQGPQNKLEIDAGINGLNPSPSGAAGASGLRFRDLHSGNTTIPNPGNGVLSVDANGDVIYVPETQSGIGNYCSVAQNPLTGDYEIPLATYNYYFSGQGTGRTNVGFGLPCSTNLGGKVHAYQLANNFFFGSNLGVSVAGRFDNYTSTNAYLGYGVVGNAAGNTSAWNIGVYGTAANAGASNFAGYFDGDVYTSGGTNSIAGYLSGSDKNIKTDVNNLRSSLEIISRLKPVSFKFDNTYAPQLKLNSTKNYGFIAQDVEKILPDIVVTSTVLPTFDSTGSLINPAKELKSLNYDGLIPFAIGGIQELNARQKEMQASIDKLNLSDAQVKTNVNTFNALATVKTLNPVKYNFTNANVQQLSFKSNTDYGFIAQQLETVYPELVDTIRVDATYDSLGTVVNPSKVLKTVNYKAMSALLVRSVQEQQQTIDSLRNTQNAILQQLAALASQINACCSNTTASRQSNSNINQLDIELSDKDAIVLNQNVPNPFAEQTTITYNVPASVEKAQLIFFNSNGQVIQTVDIKTRGKGKVNVFAADLSSGLYHYSLVADGKVVDSKKMVRE